MSTDTEPTPYQLEKLRELLLFTHCLLTRLKSGDELSDSELEEFHCLLRENPFFSPSG